MTVATNVILQLCFGSLVLLPLFKGETASGFSEFLLIAYWRLRNISEAARRPLAIAPCTVPV
jgi:hypothetical protein